MQNVTYFKISKGHVGLHYLRNDSESAILFFV